MLEGEKLARLIWVTKNYAVNPAQIVLVFHGNDGHAEVWLTNGQSKSIADRELTEEGRTLLLPSQSLTWTHASALAEDGTGRPMGPPEGRR